MEMVSFFCMGDGAFYTYSIRIIALSGGSRTYRR